MSYIGNMKKTGDNKMKFTATFTEEQLTYLLDILEPLAKNDETLNDILDVFDECEVAGIDEEDDSQPDEAQEWNNFDSEC